MIDPEARVSESDGLSITRMDFFLIALGQDVEITVRPTRKEHGQVSIVLASSSPRGSRLEDVIIFVDLSKPDPGKRPICKSSKSPRVGSERHLARASHSPRQSEKIVKVMVIMPDPASPCLEPDG